MKFIKDTQVRNAIIIGSLCSVSYFTVYIARNILGAVTPQILDNPALSEEYIGTVSSMFFILYAIGQLVNGIIGEKMKARNMLTFGLISAGICSIIFPYMIQQMLGAKIIYGMMGFFLAMIFAPMTKVVAENTKPAHAVRCSLGYEFGALAGTPIAGLLAAIFLWKQAFYVSGVLLILMGVCCFAGFYAMEKRGIVKYNQYRSKEKKNIKEGILVLVRHKIIRFTCVSILTGIVRTSVMFWLPTYIAQYLGFSPKASATGFTIASLAISMSTFLAVFVYERLHRNMELTMLVFFGASAMGFLLAYFVKMSLLNLLIIVLAIIACHGASAMLWSRYCPGLRDTGLVSSATGFLDFISYSAAAIASTVFANAVSKIGWGKLILIWFTLMICGVLVSLPKKEG